MSEVENNSSTIPLSSIGNVTNPPNGSISIKLISNPAYHEVSSTDAKICPTNNCEFYLASDFKPTSDGSGYTLDGKLYVTSGLTVAFDIQADLKEVASDKQEDGNITEKLKGTMSLISSDNSSTQAKTEYEVEGTLEREPEKEMESSSKNLKDFRQKKLDQRLLF